MKNDDIRKMFVYRLNDAKSLSISSRSIQIMKMAKKMDGLTSSELSERLGISIQNASQSLKNLHLKGYMIRVETMQASGGSEYVYESRF